MRLKKRWCIGLIVSMLGLLSGCEGISSVDSPLLEGKPFPEMELVTYDNEPFSLKQLKGKVVILKLWATWCAVCREEAPHFLAFSKKLDDSVVVVSVSVDQNVNSAKEYLLEHPNDFLQLFDKSMVQTKVVLKVSVIPQVYLIDQEGILRYFAVGAVVWDDEILKKVQRLLERG